MNTKTAQLVSRKRENSSLAPTKQMNQSKLTKQEKLLRDLISNFIPEKKIETQTLPISANVESKVENDFVIQKVAERGSPSWRTERTPPGAGTGKTAPISIA